jgi:hypothetical protein
VIRVIRGVLIRGVSIRVIRGLPRSPGSAALLIGGIRGLP